MDASIWFQGVPGRLAGPAIADCRLFECNRPAFALMLPLTVLEDVPLRDGEIVVGLERDGRVEAGQRLFSSCEIHQGKATVVVRSGNVGLNANGLPDLPFRQFVFALLEKEHPQEIGGFEIVRGGLEESNDTRSIASTTCPRWWSCLAEERPAGSARWSSASISFSSLAASAWPGSASMI